MPAVSLEKRGNIALILVDNPPVNALSHEVRIGLMAKLKEAAADEDVAAIVLGAKGRTFVAGADIKEFGKPRPDPSLHAIMDLIEASEKPVVAALFGTTLGGGLELAMACHYRIAQARTMMGQPEVNLGIIPGAGGTQRLPRLVGVPTALDMIVTGKPIDARTALEKGLVDRLAEDDLMDDAVDYAAELQAGAQPLKLASRIKIIADGIPADFFDTYRAKIAPKTRGLLAPGLAVSAVEAALTMDFADGMAIEAGLFGECMASPQSAALMHVFFAQREAGRVPHLKEGLQPREINSIGVIGGGTMGGGISMAFANAGIPVTMIEVSDEAIEASMKRIRGNYAGAIKRGKMTEEGVEERVGLISPSTDYKDLSEADLIIEAVFEKMELKKEIFGKLDEVAKPGAILATNTSYLNTDEIAAQTSRPGDVIGMHFFSPANLMRLLEIVEAHETEPDVLLTVVKLAKRIKKVGVVSTVCHGFIGNRMLEGYLREAGLLVLEGADPEDIDKALYDFGMAMGPFRVMDLAGMDIGCMLRKQFPKDRFDENAYRVNDRLVEMGRKGQKTGAGMYRYEPGSRQAISDDVTAKVIAEERKGVGFAQRKISSDEIIARCLYPLVLEGSRILEEGVAMRPGDLDVVWLTGYGFPAWRGGPMWWADDVGLAEIVKSAETFAKTHGPRWWHVGPLIGDLARKGRGFDDYYRESFPAIYG